MVRHGNICRVAQAVTKDKRLRLKAAPKWAEAFQIAFPGHTAALLKLALHPGSQIPRRESGGMCSRHWQLRHFLLQRFSILSMQIEVFPCKSTEPLEILILIKNNYCSLSFSSIPCIVDMSLVCISIRWYCVKWTIIIFILNFWPENGLKTNRWDSRKNVLHMIYKSQ